MTALLLIIASLLNLSFMFFVQVKAPLHALAHKR